jgi:hypothetical protein
VRSKKIWSPSGGEDPERPTRHLHEPPEGRAPESSAEIAGARSCSTTMPISFGSGFSTSAPARAIAGTTRARSVPAKEKRLSTLLQELENPGAIGGTRTPTVLPTGT